MNHAPLYHASTRLTGAMRDLGEAVRHLEDSDEGGLAAEAARLRICVKDLQRSAARRWRWAERNEERAA